MKPLIFICCTLLAGILHGQPTNKPAIQQLINEIWTIAKPESSKRDTPHFKFNSRELAKSALESVRESWIYMDSVRVVRQLEQQFIGHPRLLYAALAFVVGHEIRHILMEESMGFARLENLTAAEQQKEIQADKYGLLYAYFAGYPEVLGIFDSVFVVLPIKESATHPSLALRQQVNERTLEEVREWIQLFEAGQLLCAGATTERDYQYARRNFEYIKKELGIKAPPLQFHIGLSYFLEGLMERSHKVENFVFPIEFSDFNALQRMSQAKYSGKNLWEAAHDILVTLVDDEEVGEQAKTVLASIEVLKGCKAEKTWLNSLKDPATKQLLEGIASGILARENQDSTSRKTSEQIFNTLLDDPKVGGMAQINLKILQNDTAEASHLSRMPECVLDGPLPDKSDALNTLGQRVGTEINLGLFDEKNLLFYQKNDKKTLFFWEKWSNIQSIALIEIDHPQCPEGITLYQSPQYQFQIFRDKSDPEHLILCRITADGIKKYYVIAH